MDWHFNLFLNKAWLDINKRILLIIGFEGQLDTDGQLNSLNYATEVTDFVNLYIKKPEPLDTENEGDIWHLLYYDFLTNS